MRRNRRITALSVAPYQTGEIHKVSDKGARLWESYYGPMNGAALALNAAIINVQNILGRIIMQLDGYDPDTHSFDPSRMVIVPRPVATEH